MKMMLSLAATAIVSMLFAFSAPAFADPATMTLCTGGKSGNYRKAGDLLAKTALKPDEGQVPIQISVALSDGSPKNLERMDATGEQHCDAAFVQNDVLVTYKKTYPNLISGLDRGGTLYNEWVHLICNKNSGIEKITDLDETKTIAIGKPSQGHNVTWQGFRNASQSGWFSGARYDKVKVDEREMGYAILTDVNEGNGPDCLLYVGAFGAPFIATDAASSDFENLRLINAVDDDMKEVMDDKGKPLYSFAEIPGEQYANLLEPGWFSSGNIPTVGVPAVFVITSDWVSKNPEGHEAVLRAFTKSKKGIADLVKPVD